MKYEKSIKIPKGLWRDGVIATRPMETEPAKKTRRRAHHGKILNEDVAEICLSCTRKECAGTCKKASEACKRKKAENDG